MTCLDPARLAAAASGDDVEAEAHAEACAACGAEVAAQRQVRAALAAMRAPRWSDVRRAEVLAAALAVAERPVAPPRWRRAAVIGAVVAAAAAAALVVGARRDDARRSLPALAVAERATAAPPPGVAAARIEARRGTRMVRRAAADRDHVEVADGDLAVDATGGVRPVTVSAGDTAIDVRDARVVIVVHDQAVATVQVFAGSVEVIARGQRVRVEVGELWRAPEPPVAVAPPVPPAEPPRRPPAPVTPPPAVAPPTDGVEVAAVEPAVDDEVVPPLEPLPYERPAPWSGFSAFQAGWRALQAGDLRTARRDFDGADDPQVAEDAAYWAAVCSDRLGELDDARRRYRAFVRWFPRSPRVAAVRAALVRVEAAAP